MTILGYYGGYLVKEFGIIKSLLISGFSDDFKSLICFANSVGPEISYLFLTIAGENFRAVWVTAFVLIYRHYVIK